MKEHMIIKETNFAVAKSIEPSVLIGNRIPKDFFITKGKGESDITVHAGSYHLSLKSAGIEMANIMTYSSILPSIANEIPKPEKIIHGSVMETIMSVANGTKGDLVTSGIIYGTLFNKHNGDKYGGLVCEHNGSYTVNEISKNLKLSLNELYTNGFEEDYELKNIKIITESFIPNKKYGTAIVALCFTTYQIPIISISLGNKK